jgi:hypothetical protein
MNPAPRTSTGRSIFSIFAVQAALTAVFGLFDFNLVHGPAAQG